MADPFDVRLCAEPLDPVAEMARFSLPSSQGAEDGAIASFVGICRGGAHDGERLVALVLEIYRGMTLRSMEEIVATARERFAIGRACVVHRHGRILPGEPIVLVAVAAAHRRAAISAMDYIMDRLKSDAVFWKREETALGSQWIEPTDTDYSDKARW